MNNRRPAFTLVELLTTLTVGSTLMLLAVNLVHQTLLLSQAARDKVQRMQASNLFMDQFRREIHAAQSVAVISEQELEIESQDDSLVVYRVIEGKLMREQQNTVGISNHNALNFGDRSNCQFELLQEPQRVALTIQTQIEGKSLQTRIERRVEAVVGRTRRLRIPLTLD